tara:strand:+ start:2119 stop:3423 length:1305 start_codon:yes stop_codon:yes gene_type:complete
MIYKRSSQLFEEAKTLIPGGVNSPVRAFKSVGGTPIFIKKAKGAYLFDEDDNKYIDYISSWGPMILGHAKKEIIKKIMLQVEKGTSYGIPTELESELASLIVSNIKNIDKIRFVNSGTEACMSAIRLARGYTGRDKIVKFKGCYHGHSDSFLIEAGSGAVTFGQPNSPGVTKSNARDTLIANYNDIESVEKIFDKYKKEIACVIIEPVAGNMGCIPPEKNFLKNLRTICNNFGSLLIFDEVMTGFRLSFGGAQEYIGVKADIVTYGKVVGGGLPVGAFASRDEIMEMLAPEGPIYQAGTLSGNPLAMRAGLETLKFLKNDIDFYKRINNKTQRLYEGFLKEINHSGIPCQANISGSMLSVHFTKNHVTDFDSAAQGNNKTFKDFFHFMLSNGIYLPPSAFESYFLNDALTLNDVDFTIEIFRKFLKKFNHNKIK